MDFEKLFNSVEDYIEVQPETTAAEEAASELLLKLKDTDPDLYFELDGAIGALARAYEKQGFAGGLALSKAVTL